MLVIKKNWVRKGDVLTKLPLNTKLTPWEVSLLQRAMEEYKGNMRGTMYEHKLDDLINKVKASFEIRIRDKKACGYV